MTRDEPRRVGKRTRDALAQHPPTTGALGHDGVVSGFAQLISEAVFGAVWSRPDLPLDQPMVCALAVVGLRAPPPELAALVTSTRDGGLAARSILKTSCTTGCTAGSARPRRPACRRTRSSRGEASWCPSSRRGTSRWTTSTSTGVHSCSDCTARATQGHAAPQDPVTGDLYALAIRYGYGEQWSRPGLDHRQRLLRALAAFKTLGMETQLLKFAQAAVDNGFGLEQVIEAVSQSAPYAGFPRALNALAALSRSCR